VLADLHEHLALHLPVQVARLAGQLDADDVDDRLAQVEPVFRVDAQTDVAQSVLDLLLRKGQGLEVETVERFLEPALGE
jgi:hypothetical protein